MLLAPITHDEPEEGLTHEELALILGEPPTEEVLQEEGDAAEEPAAGSAASVPAALPQALVDALARADIQAVDRGSEHVRSGALFCLFTLFFSQPCQPRVKIYLTLEHAAALQGRLDEAGAYCRGIVPDYQSFGAPTLVVPSRHTVPHTTSSPTQSMPHSWPRKVHRVTYGIRKRHWQPCGPQEPLYLEPQAWTLEIRPRPSRIVPRPAPVSILVRVVCWFSVLFVHWVMPWHGCVIICRSSRLNHFVA